ncbi:DASH complex subunit Dad1 [Schizosaccharomyces japonicus yFS275]|uniref:DASH complex subunit DAD1 n=1 Tax=Schizosaccharomyces japonicus (strain yFS275 / FY16936) TaxID=402676 RepID=B6JYV4_SCHJY|nr:DASH complex subunit Dad1 [Schizosaccharomyces japonicus yFS275]EEB06722.1 DASH complex subunit Dad1 [Schizosaccharomyces japonicus yFS275]
MDTNMNIDEPEVDLTNESSTFERKRRQLILQISNNMHEIVNLLDVLNKNLESVNGVGKEFDKVASLWMSFHESVTNPPVENDNGNAFKV